MYADAPDPWRLADRWYEHRKYTLTLASLPRRRYRRAFEPGCSVGVLTRMLAGRCEEVVAADRVATA
ncbi:SAM-dependent methyltransferase, partial [Streptomyces sp. NRRL F-6602]